MFLMLRSNSYYRMGLILKNLEVNEMKVMSYNTLFGGFDEMMTVDFKPKQLLLIPSSPTYY